MTEDTREDVMQLDVDGGERQESGDGHVDRRRSIPYGRRNLTLDTIGLTRRLKALAGGVRMSRAHRSEDGQREGHERPQQDDDDDGLRRQRGGRAVIPGDAV